MWQFHANGEKKSAKAPFIGCPSSHCRPPFQWATALNLQFMTNPIRSNINDDRDGERASARRNGDIAGMGTTALDSSTMQIAPNG